MPQNLVLFVFAALPDRKDDFVLKAMPDRRGDLVFRPLPDRKDDFARPTFSVALQRPVVSE
jgi:hypothetical protein